MATRRTMFVSISPELLAFAERLRASGCYGNLSGVVRTALRQMEERELDFQAHRDKRAKSAPDEFEHRSSERERVAPHV